MACDGSDGNRRRPHADRGADSNEITVGLLLEKGANFTVECPTLPRQTPPLVASKWGAVRLLRDKGANINYEDSGNMALHLATRKGHMGVLKVLLAGGP